MATIVKRERNKNKPWAVRWRDDTGHQREAAFKYQSEATVFKKKLEAAQLDGSWVDPRKTRDTFSEAAAQWLENHPVSASTKRAYGTALNSHITPAMGDRLLRHVAQDRDAVTKLVNVSMIDLSESRREIALIIVTGTLDAAVTAGKIPQHRCSDIKLAPGAHKPGREDFIFPSHQQIETLAKGMGNTTIADNLALTIWLMRGCGLRISEALAVRKQGFRDSGSVLRINEQVAEHGRTTGPLKHRKSGEYRDIPVPSYLWEMVKDQPDGYLFIRPSGRFQIYASYREVFIKARAATGIPDGFTPHSLRHAFVSALLSRNVPITDVSKWIGHRSIDVTYNIYGHLLPSAWGRAVETLDAEFKDWSTETP